MWESTVSISDFKMHLQTLFHNVAVVYLVAGSGIILTGILHANSLAKTPFSQHDKKILREGNEMGAEHPKEIYMRYMLVSQFVFQAHST